jgi:energy-coupling factor transporter ATP-binding protein EcfA2
MPVTYHHIVLAKTSQRHLNADSIITNQIPHIMGAITRGMAVKGWAIKPMTVDASEMVSWHETPLLDESADKYKTELYFTVTHSGDAKPNPSEIKAIAKTMHTRGINPLGGRWSLASIDGTPYVIQEGETLSTKDFSAYAPCDIPMDYESHFDHLYGLESHVARVRMALEVAIMSQFSNRYHVALVGPPGCGKSDICETLASILPEGSVMKFDATATTAAGAIKQLDGADILPRILVVEEIEKINAEAMSFLLALMDMRGEIRKTTARETINKDAKILVIATVNNHVLFDNMLAGALSSRFSNKLWFHRPSKDVLGRILAREIMKLDGDMTWIQPVIEYAEEKNITDPRMLCALCLCGRDGWLDGTFVKMLADTDKPQEYETQN